MADDALGTATPGALAEGDERVGALVRHIRTDVDRYLARIGRA